MSVRRATRLLHPASNTRSPRLRGGDGRDVALGDAEEASGGGRGPVSAMQFDSSSFKSTKRPGLVFRALLDNYGIRDVRFERATLVDQDHFEGRPGKLWLIDAARMQ